MLSQGQAQNQTLIPFEFTVSPVVGPRDQVALAGRPYASLGK